MLLAEGDLAVRDNAGWSGHLYARGHCLLSGAGQFTGQIVCRSEADDVADRNLSNTNVVSGSLSQTFTCNGLAAGTVRTRAWSQRR